jgi:putative mRNA 3-end processing factor
MADLLQLTERGFYCEAGNFYVDPWQPVERAVVTHAHADHYAWGCRSYLVSDEGKHVFRTRLGHKATIQTAAYGDSVDINGVKVRFHPAGHILGSSQVRVEHAGEVWVVSGDYKLEADPTCTAYEPVRGHTFITEATFGLPIYRWQPQADSFAEINAWWRENAAAGRASVLFGYALGKAQRLLAGVDPTIGPIYTHGAVEKINKAYRDSNISLPHTKYANDAEKPNFRQALIVAPPSARGTTWLRRFGDLSTGFASGWMRIRGTRRRRAVDRGFVLSDHIDWAGLMEAIDLSEAETVWITHGYVDVVARWLNEHGKQAVPIRTRYRGEADDADQTPDETTETDDNEPQEST